MAAEEFTLNLADGRELTGLRTGAPDAPKLVALHGWLDNAASFTALAAELASYEVWAIDWPGHGGSDHRSRHEFYHFTDWLFDLELALDALPWPGPKTVVGHSLGGAIAAIFAAARPVAIDQLVLIESLGPFAEPAVHVPDRLGRFLAERKAALNRREAVYPSLEPVVRQRLKVSDLPEAAARALVERNMIRGAEGYRWRSDSRLKLPSPVRLTEEQVLACLARVSARTLAIWAEPGMGFGREALARREATVASLTSRAVTGGHHVHMEQPEAVASMIRAFLEKGA